MTLIDWACVVLWVVGTSVFGVYFQRYIGSTRDYLLAGRRLRWWQIGVAQAADAVDACDFVAVTGQGFRTGLVQLGYAWWGMGIGSVLLSRYVAPLLYRTGVYTNAQYLELRFGRGLRLASAMLQVLYRFVAMALVVYAVATMFKVIIDFDLWLGVWLAMWLTLAYVFTSGQLGTVMAAIPQMALMVLTSVLIFAFAASEIGGWSGYCDHIAGQEQLSHLSGYCLEGVPGPVYLWGLILTLVTYPIVNQTVAQRILGATSEADARKGTIISLLPWCLITGSSIVVGIMATGILTGLGNADADTAFPLLMKRYLGGAYVPPGLLGLGVAALTVASMSTGAGIGTAIAGLVTVDVFGMLGRAEMSDRKRLLVTRLIASLAIVCGTTFAMLIPRFGGMIPFYVAFTGTFFLPLTVPYLGGAFFRWVTRRSGMAALLAGIVLGAVLFLAEKSLPVWLAQAQWRPFWVLGVTWLVLILWSLVERSLVGPIPTDDLASVLNCHDLGRETTPEGVAALMSSCPAAASLRDRPGDGNDLGTPSDSNWLLRPATFELAAVLLMIVLMIYWW